MIKNKTNRQLLITLWLLAAVFLAACNTSAGEGAVTPEPLPDLEGDTAVSTPIPTLEPAAPIIQDNIVTVFGTVEPVDWGELSFLRSGQVEEIFIAVGDAVVTGQPLARLHTPDSGLAVAAAQAALETAQARLAETSAGITAEQIAVTEAELAAAEAAVLVAETQYNVVASSVSDADIAAAEAAVAAADAQMQITQDRYDYLIINETLGAPEEQTRYQLYADQLSLAAAQAALDAVESGPSSQARGAAWSAINQAQAQATSTQAAIDLLQAPARPETLAVLQAEVHEAEIVLAQAQAAADLAQEEAVLTAPFDGIIISVGMRPAQAVTSDEAVILLADLAKLQVTAQDLDELYVTAVHPGQSATLTLDALPGKQINGTVSLVSLGPINNDIEGEGTHYAVTVALDETVPDLRWGMSAHIRIQADEAE